MKILLNIGAFYPAVCYGGPIFSTLNLSKALIKKGVDLKVVTTNVNCKNKLNVELNHFIETEGVKVKYYGLTISNKYAFSFMQLLFLWKDIKNCDLQYINSIFTFNTLFGLIYAKFLKKPVILAPRGSLSCWSMKYGSKFKKYWLAYCISPLTYNVEWHATSKEEKEDILNYFLDAKIQIVANGIYVEEYKKSNSFSKKNFLKKYAQQDIEIAEQLVVSMGRLQKLKGFDILIESFHNIVGEYSNAFLLIAGPDEGEKDKLESQIMELGLRNRVYLVGDIQNQDKIDFMANADVFVLPSHSENFGNVYLESLASGTPIIASLGTPWSDVEKYNCGKWVENSVEETSKAILIMLKKDRELMRENSFQLASEYDWSNIARQFIEKFNLETGERQYGQHK